MMADNRPFPTISMDDFREKYFGNVDDREFLACLKEDLAQEVAEGKLSKEKADEICAIAEIKAISTGTRYHVQHVVRNHMQVIAGHAETQGLNDVYIRTPTTERLTNELIKAYEKLAAINEAVQAMSEDMRRLGL